MKRIISFCTLLSFFILTTLNASIVQIISFNDFHGSMSQNGSNPGMAKFATAIKDQIKKYPDSTILVSAGDNYQGSALSVLTYGAPVNEMMKELNVKASAVGNHEFDWGIDKIKEWSDKGNFPYLAANIADKKTGKPVSWAKPYLIINVNGAKIAFIGLTTLESAYKTRTENVKDIKFLDPADALQKWINYLKEGKASEGKPDTIIALCHIASYQDKKNGQVTGEELEPICSKVEGLDAFISGHSHELVCGCLDNIPVTQAYKYGRALGILDLDFNDNNQLVKITPSVISVTDKIKTLTDDPQTKAIYEKYSKKMEKIDKVIGTAEDNFIHNNHYKGVSTLGELVCKIMAEQTDSQIAITNGGGLRCGIKKGNVTISEMYELMPFDNYVETLELSGNDLKRVIEHGLFNPDPDTGDAQFYGVKVYYNSKAPYMNRIESMTLLDGTPIQMDKYYKVATVDFLVTGGDQYDFSGAKDIRNTHISLRDMLISSISKIETLKPVPVNYLIDTSDEQQKAA